MARIGRPEYVPPTDYGLAADGTPNTIPLGHASLVDDRNIPVTVGFEQTSRTEGRMPPVVAPAPFGQGWNIAAATNTVTVN